MQNYGVGAAAAAAPAVKRRTDSYEAAQHHPHTPSSGENSRCESDEEYVNTRILRRRMELQSTPLMAATVSAAPTTTAGSAEATAGTAMQHGHVEQPEFLAGGPTSSTASYNEDRMRRKLQFFFMNPIEKWQARRKFPYKFVVQIVKIILVTMQLCLFAHSRYNHINYTWDNRIAFSHLFLKGWESSREVESYPPAVGPFALYEKSEFFSTVQFAVDGYGNMNRSIGPYYYPTANNTMPPLTLCMQNYREGTIFGFNESYIFDPHIDEVCEKLPPNVSSIGVKQYLQDQGVEVNFASLVTADLTFKIKTVNFKANGGPLSAPDCFKFDLTILFNNRDHDGQMLLSLDAQATRLKCRGDTDFISEARFDSLLRSMLNIFVIFTCALSFALCTRALWRAYLLKCTTINFFRSHFNKELSFDGRLEFVNFWYIMIIFNDVLLIIGSALKEQIEGRYMVVDQWDTCSLFLGIGNMLVWFGVLRYLGFFKTYNVVILTLKKAAPKILRFLIAALLIYAGFVFCGWLILGPYHMKFRSLATTSECLFSLINGDDMFATFSTISNKATWLWWFCQIYLYSFIALYIYVVLSLFIAVIMDAYDTIKKYYKDGFPTTDLKAFVGTRTAEDISSGVFLNNLDDFEQSSFWDIVKSVCCCSCCKRRLEPDHGNSGYASLSSIMK